MFIFLSFKQTRVDLEFNDNLGFGEPANWVLAKKQRRYGKKKPATNYIIVVGLKMGPLKNQETVNLKLSDSTKF